jgi:GNAT superfamily N-acetyltransferase
MPTDVTRTYLQMTSPAELEGADVPPRGARIARLHECPPSFYRYLYREVGRAYHWVDRLSWSDEQFRARLADPVVLLYLLTAGESPAGYYELERHGDGAIEVAYFGLLPEFLGRGLGKYLLTDAVQTAWSLGTSRVWLHTCTLDDPAALPNYLKRGFKPFKSEVYQVA